MTSVTITQYTRTLLWDKLKPFLLFMSLQLIPVNGYCQWTFDTDPLQNELTLNIVDDFHANPNDNLDDTWAFIKAAWYLSNEADINGVRYTTPTTNIDYSNTKVRLVIPPGSLPNSRYLVGLQIKQSDPMFDNYRPAPNTDGYQYKQIHGDLLVHIKYRDFFNSTNSSTWPDNTNDATFDIGLIREMIQSVVGANTSLSQITKYEQNTNPNCGSCNFWQPYVVSRCTTHVATTPQNLLSCNPSNCVQSTVTNYNEYW